MSFTNYSFYAVLFVPNEKSLLFGYSTKKITKKIDQTASKCEKKKQIVQNHHFFMLCCEKKIPKNAASFIYSFVDGWILQMQKKKTIIHL